jgi:plastocyanin
MPDSRMLVFIILGIGGIVGLIFIFPYLLGLTSNFHGSSHAPSPISEVYLPERATSPDAPKNFEPSTISVTIGLNNKVRWSNYDFKKSSVLADDKSDPGFFTATHNGTSDEPTRESSLNSYETFEYTFTKAGEYGYHCNLHPWMKGVVIVLPERTQ